MAKAIVSIKTQKLVSAILVGSTVVLGFQALIYILNLNQVRIFLQLAFWLWLYLVVIIAFLYDLHFKNPGSIARARQKHQGIDVKLRYVAKVISSAFWDRIEHFRRWEHVKLWQNYLLLPGFVFWATVCLFFLNFGRNEMQQLFAAISSTALIITYWYLKEIFHRRTEKVQPDIFIALSVVKIYAAGALFAAGFGIMHSFCLDPKLYAGLVFALTFFLVYQALFQHRLVNLTNLGFTLLIALLMSVLAYFVFLFWSYNFYTAGILLAAFYNLFWGVFHYHLDRALTKYAFFEILVISLLIAAMVMQVTNFKERIINAC